MVEDLSKHKMESEQMIIGQEAANKINDALTNRKKVCAVGTTVIRSMESSVSTKNMVIPFDGWTSWVSRRIKNSKKIIKWFIPLIKNFI